VSHTLNLFWFVCQSFCQSSHSEKASEASKQQETMSDNNMTIFPAVFGAFAVTIFLIAIIRIICIRRWMYNRPVVVYTVVTEGDTSGLGGPYQPYPQQPVYGQPVYGQQPGQYGQQPPPQQVYGSGNAAYQQPPNQPQPASPYGQQIYQPQQQPSLY
jgi:hypothetical protein